MGNFEKAIEVVLRHEGGFSNHPDDSGGPTNFGLSQKFLVKTIPSNKWGIDEIKAITRDQAIQIYKTFIWLDEYNLIFHEIVSTKIFDMAVNMGNKKAHILTQNSCNDIGSSLVADGILGKLSLSEINMFANNGKQDMILIAICRQQENHYREIVRKNPKKVVFLSNWLHRAKWPFKDGVEA